MTYKYGNPSSPAAVSTYSDGIQSTDASTGVCFTVTLNSSGTNTIANPSNLQEGQTYTWVLNQAADTAVNVVFGTKFLFASGTSPTITQTTGATDVLRGTAIDVGGVIKLFCEFEADVKSVPDYSNSYSFQSITNSYASVLTFDPADTSSWSNVTSGPLYDVFEYTNAFSFSGWLKNSWSGSGNAYFAGRYSYSDSTGLGIGVSGSGTTGGGGNLVVYFRTSTGQAHYLYAGGIADGNWHHVTLTYDGSGASSGWAAYIDGSSSSLTAITGDTMTSGTTKQGDTPFALCSLRGNVGTSYNYISYPGYMDEVSVWDTELSSGDVTSIYNSGAPNDLNAHAQAASLISWWRLGDAGGDNMTGTNTGTNATVNVVKDVSTSGSYSRSDGSALNRTSSSGQADFVTDVPT